MSGWGKYKRCKTCGEYGWVNRHKCPPKWHAMLLENLRDEEDDPDVWSKVYAEDPERAAVKYVEQWDQEECEVTETSFVVVRDPLTYELTYHLVSGEMVPEYTRSALMDSKEAAALEFQRWFHYDPLK
jgi:hypothetical protein